MTHGGGLTFCQNFSSPALTVWDRQCCEHSEQKYDQLNESMCELTTKVFEEQPCLHRVC